MITEMENDLFPQKKHNLHLEAIRGGACLLVIITHVSMKLSNVNFPFDPHIITFFTSWATEAVIVFFILSGVVITSSLDRIQSVSAFISARLTRIYPILIFAVLISTFIDVLVLNQPFSIATFVGNLIPISTLHGNFIPVLQSNPVIWSLSFEVFFYVFFALFILEKNKIKKLNLWIWFIFSMVCITIFFFKANYEIPIIDYLIMMFSFSAIWIIGIFIWLWRSRIAVGRVNFFFSLTSLPLISRLHLTTNYYDPLKFLLFAITAIPFFIFLIQLHISKNGVTVNIKLIILQLFIYLLGTIFILLDLSYSNYIKMLYVLFPLISLLFTLNLIYTVVKILYNKLLKPVLVRIGKISYSLYLIHFPIITVIFYSDALNIFTKLLLSLFISSALSLWLELIFQPFIKKTIKSVI